jgi:hypothetical protein
MSLLTPATKPPTIGSLALLQSAAAAFARSMVPIGHLVQPPTTVGAALANRSRCIESGVVCPVCGSGRQMPPVSVCATGTGGSTSSATRCKHCYSHASTAVCEIAFSEYEPSTYKPWSRRNTGG